MNRKVLSVLVLTTLCACLLCAEDRPAIAMDSKGRLLLAWIDGDPKLRRAFVKRWEDGAWKSLGGPVNNSMADSAPYISLAVDSKDRPFAAWTETERDRSVTLDFGKVWIARWDDDHWTRFAAVPSSSDLAQADIPIIRTDSKGNPFVFWNDTSPYADVDHYYLSRWDGKAWQVIDPGTLSTDLSSSSRGRDFVLDSKDQPILAWSLHVFKKDFNVFAGSWNGKRWQPYGSTLNLDEQRYASAPSIVLDSKDRPFVAFTQAKFGFDLWIKHWNGQTWEQLGDSPNAGSGGARNPRIVLDKSGRPIVAFVDNQKNDKLFVKRWDGTKWLGFAGPLNKTATANVLFYALAADADGQPVVAWSEEQAAAAPRIFIERWAGSAWVDIP